MVALLSDVVLLAPTWANADASGPKTANEATVMLLGLGFLGLVVGKWKLNRRSHAA